MDMCPVCDNFFDIVDGKTDEKNSISMYQCSNCNTTKKIENGTIVFTKWYNQKNNESYQTKNLTRIVDSSILQSTREYTCPNKNCESHKNLEKREAVMFRLYESYEIVYICKSCETKF